jgi:hypothetical protein
MQTYLTLKSTNVKTGPIPVSTTTSKSCPTSCALKGSGCYAEYGPLGIHWRKVTEGTRGTDFDTFIKSIKQLPEGQFWRHNQAGDLPGAGDRIDRGNLMKLARANKGRRGFTYTHKPVINNAANRNAVEAAVKAGFTINLSANNLKQADQLADLGVAPVVVVLDKTVTGKADLKTPQGRRVVVCPATYIDDSSCAKCQLCQRAGRNVIVGFPAHGAARNKASKVAA